MPRIDPLQLLKCLSVLLSPEGGILSQEEVPRLVNLMTKFSKKLVSKCVYILILKGTQTPLVDMFMGEGGWALIQTWLQDAVHSGNWDLVKETLELLLVTPVDVERLKTNSLPKLIKTLSRREDLPGVAELSNRIVQKWLVIVKQSGQGAQISAQVPPTESSADDGAQPEITSDNGAEEAKSVVDIDDDKPKDEPDGISCNNFYKLSLRDGRQVIQKCEDDGEKKAEEKKSEKRESSSKHSSSSSKKSKSSSRSSSSSSSNGSSRDKDKGRSSGSSSRSKSRDDDKKSSRDKRDSGREKGRSSSSSSSSGKSKDRGKDKDRRSSKDPKERQSERDKDTLAKLKPQVLEKLGRIPKKPKKEDPSDVKKKEDADAKKKDDSDVRKKDDSDVRKKDESDVRKKDDSDVKKKPTFSILDRKSTSEERAKTVKVFNSRMRSTGLEQEAKPPPPRTAKKPPAPPPAVAPKRPSPPPPPEPSVPPEKKIKMDKVDAPERPGAIKLIPPKPKPPVLQESDIFMDALTASATAKKEPKKRKRRPSVTKDPTSPASSPARTETPTTTATSPTTTAAPTTPVFSAPINFYQDTLNEKSEEVAETKEENKENSNSDDGKENSPASPPTTPTDSGGNDEEIVEPKKLNAQGLRGVLLYAKKKGPKRGIQWKNDDSLVEIRYFELDETERINVTRTFTDMAKMEMTSEREALQASRKLCNEDVMEAQTHWRVPFLCEQPDQLVVSGCKSLEKDIQFAREKSVLQAFYFDKRRIPDSAEEPDAENHAMSDPVIIPLEDPDSQEIDLRNTPWPEPKGAPPEVETRMHAMFTTMPAMPFNNIPTMPPAQFQAPRFAMPMQAAPMYQPGPAMMPPNMLPPQMVQPQEMAPMFAPNPEGFIGPENFQQNFQPPANMFPPPNSFKHNNRVNRGNFRRGGGGMNNGGWVRLNANGPQDGGAGANSWKRMGRGGRGGRMCKNVQNHGYCRNRDNCSFIHP